MDPNFEPPPQRQLIASVIGGLVSAIALITGLELLSDNWQPTNSSSSVSAPGRLTSSPSSR